MRLLHLICLKSTYIASDEETVIRYLDDLVDALLIDSRGNGTRQSTHFDHNFIKDAATSFIIRHQHIGARVSVQGDVFDERKSSAAVRVYKLSTISEGLRLTVRGGAEQPLCGDR